MGCPRSWPWESTQPRTATKSLTKLGIEHLKIASFPRMTVSWNVWVSYTWLDTGINNKLKNKYFCSHYMKASASKSHFCDIFQNDADVTHKSWLYNLILTHWDNFNSTIKWYNVSHHSIVLLVSDTSYQFYNLLHYSVSWKISFVLRSTNIIRCDCPVWWHSLGIWSNMELCLILQPYSTDQYAS